MNEQDRLIALAEKCGAEVGRYEGEVVWIKLHKPSIEPFAAALSQPHASAQEAAPSDDAMVHAAYGIYNYRQGTREGIAFNDGARWMQEALAAPVQAAPTEPVAWLIDFPGIPSVKPFAVDHVDNPAPGYRARPLGIIGEPLTTPADSAQPAKGEKCPTCGYAAVNAYDEGYSDALSATPAPADKLTDARGWKLVPIEPTEEMIAAAAEGRVLQAYVGAKEKADAIIVKRYKAMLSASPARAIPAQGETE